MSPRAFLQNPIARQSMQAGLAAVLSIGCGAMISGHRWYWAAIAAFIVGVGVGSRSEALMKGLQRVGGTIGGIIVGVFLAAGVSGHTDLALGLLLVFTFISFYAFQTAYGLMIFGITLMVALLYGMLGMFRPGLLVLRLEETAVGAAIGVAVTFFVLPTPEAASLRQAVLGFLDALAEAVSQAGAEDRETRVAAIRDMQAKAQAMRTSLGAVKRGWGPFSPFRYRRAVHGGMYCAYLARELVGTGGVGKAETEALLSEIRCTRGAVEQDGGETRAGAAPGDSGAADRDETPLVRALREALHRLAARMREV